MNTWWLIGIGLTLGAAIAFIFLRRGPESEAVAVPAPSVKKGPVEVKRNAPSRKDKHFYGAAVQVGRNPCDAVKAMANQRFLSDEAPRFPLPDCNRSECRCFVQPQSDRRAGYDRRGDSFSAYGNFEADRHEQKRGQKRDRRVTS